MAKAISGLAKAAQDPQSGAEAGYWVLTQYTVKLLQGKTQAVLRGFASAEAAEQGLRAYANLVVEVEGAPAGDAPQWIYQNLIDSESSPLAGATSR
ncbi:hypothetical protein [Alloalcanivorax xenomutans]|uniref:hypothetical protein n=1 Tax=Alloalcanivorax xenomutans TaxID=1094342 RepID=UPI00047A9937